MKTGRDAQKLLGVVILHTLGFELQLCRGAVGVPYIGAHLAKVARLRDPTRRIGIKIPHYAQKVGWRILKDWVAAQMAIVEAGAAELAEVFLPYAMQRDGKTMYQAFEEQQHKALRVKAGDEPSRVGDRDAARRTRTAGRD